MMKIFFLFLVLCSSPSWAQNNMHFELAQDRVDISTGFDGAEIVAFGTLDNLENLSLAITIKGPETKMIVRQKERGITGVWRNGNNVEFRRVLRYYDYAFYNGKQLSPDNILFNNSKLDVENLEFYPEDDLDEAELEPYRDALIRNMRLKGFYPIKSGDVNFFDDNLFKLTFILPPGVPTGNYTVEAIVMKDGQIIESQARALHVGQVGFNARVYIYATQYSFVYGLLAVLLAIVLGWSAFTFLRRD